MRASANAAMSSALSPSPAYGTPTRESANTALSTLTIGASEPCCANTIIDPAIITAAAPTIAFFHITLPPEGILWRSSRKQAKYIGRSTSCSRKHAPPLQFTASRHHTTTTLAIEPAFHFGQFFAIKVRKANNGADKQEKHGELGVHLSASSNLYSTATKIRLPKTKTRVSRSTCVNSA